MIKPDEWWFCEGDDTLIQGPGFDFKNLVCVVGDKLLLRPGADPDNPIEIPLDKLTEYLQRKR